MAEETKEKTAAKKTTAVKKTATKATTAKAKTAKKAATPAKKTATKAVKKWLKIIIPSTCPQYPI